MRLLIVSPHFPPTNAPDMHRARTALPHLRDLGWEATVLAVDPQDVAAPRDDQLIAGLPAHVPIVRCRAWPLRVTQRFGLRTLGWRSWRALDRAGSALLRTGQFDLVLFTTTQFLVTTLGPRWLRRFGVPYVVDLQDPWLTDYYERPGAPPPPGGWKYHFAHFVAKKLEARAFRDAAGFISVSPAYFDALARRYPWFAAKPQAVIPFGVEPSEYTANQPTSAPAFVREPGHIHLVSVGALGPIMASAIRALLTQVQDLRARSPELASRLRLHFIGTSYAPAGQAKASVLPLAADLGLADLIAEQTDRVPWRTAQATMQAADGLLILTSDEASYTPSKIAGCFLARRPALVVTGAESGAARLTAELGFGLRLDPSGHTPMALADFLELVLGPTENWLSSRQENSFLQQYTAVARTRAMMKFLTPLTTPSRKGVATH